MFFNVKKKWTGDNTNTENVKRVESKHYFLSQIYCNYIKCKITKHSNWKMGKNQNKTQLDAAYKRLTLSICK